MKTTDCFDDSVLKKASSLRNKGYGTYGVCIPTPPPNTHTPSPSPSPSCIIYFLISAQKPELLPGLHQEAIEQLSVYDLPCCKRQISKLFDRQP